MKYSFDTTISREGTNSYKYDWRKKIFGKEDVIPLWVADMDFRIADEIVEDIKKRADHGIFGYTFQYDNLYGSVINFMKKRHNWQIEKDWIIFFHGVMPSVSLTIQAFTEPGNKIIVQPPVYFPLFQTIQNNKREVLYNQLIIENGKYTIDFEDLERRIDNNTKMLLFCHPHNPVGRVWTKEELITLDNICQKNNILVVSDEIHCDIVYPGFKHIPFATISNHAALNSITCIAPSKTFNIAGLAISVMIIPNKKLCSRVNRIIRQGQLHGINVLGMTALESAYNKGEACLNQLMQYLQENLDFIDEYFEKNIPQIDFIKPEATYLAWLDCKKLGLDKQLLKKFMIQEANVGLSDGPTFGPGGEGYQRLNFASPRPVIKKALEQIKCAIEKYL